jgi:hypothetical protein
MLTGGLDQIDVCSSAYRWGIRAGFIGGFLIPGGEFVAGAKLARAARVTHLHHLLPRQFVRFFEAAGLKINQKQFLVRLDAEFHRLLHGKGGGEAWENSWNQQWRKFFEQNPNASGPQVLAKLDELRGLFGI